MRVLVACEFSGTVREAFAARGHDAWSCDLLPTEVPGKHIQGDVLKVLGHSWDIMIAHPPCTHLAVSGARWFKDKLPQQAEALEFVRALLSAPIPRIALENPVSIISSRIAPPPASDSAVAIRAWRDEADVSLAQRLAPAPVNRRRCGTRESYSSHAARRESLARAKSNLSRHRKGNG